MKVTELINRLTAYLAEHGDHDVWVYDNNCAGHYGCEPWNAIDGNDGVSPYQLTDGTQVARMETTW